MKSFKKIIKSTLPTNLLWRYKYRLDNQSANITYAEIEKKLTKKFEKKFGYRINWENPKTYNEKLNVSKLYNPTLAKTQLTDKVLVRDWVRKQVPEKDCKLIPLIATFDTIDEIDFSKLPDEFVIKMNNDSGSVYIYDAKRPIAKELIASYKYYYQKRNFAYKGYEMHYKNIQPKIMIEKYMGDSIRDYKFQCFDGKVVSCRVDFNRFGDHTRNFYDKHWKLLSYNKGNYVNYPKPVKKPANFEKMWRLAEKLSKGFDQVRVDFYDIDGEIYFGEMTFTNGSGFEEFHPAKKDKEFGELWHLDMDTIRKRRQELLSSGARIGD